MGDRLLSVQASPAFWLAVFAYAVAALGSGVGFVVGDRRWARLARWALVVGVIAHGVDISWRGVDHVHPAASVRESLGFLAWIIALGYLAASWRWPMELAGVVLIPIVTIILAAARLSPAGHPQADLSVLGRIHISLATVGVAIFALAAALSAIYLIEDRNLRRKKFDARSFKQPQAPLAALDRGSQRLVLAGFPIFTVAMVLGMLWVSQRGSDKGRPEYPMAMITWLTYAGLLAARATLGWRGRKTAWLTLAGFGAALIVLAIYFLRRVTG
ncbi:MAG TPA: cytochrome c biogenesis protein CcsA [Kofleriaceae bacterium]|nr:cytochrome c biogenesis protein CcsA [Kofleriaceae bacterium]